MRLHPSSSRLSLCFQSRHHLAAALSPSGSGEHCLTTADSHAEETLSARNLPAHASMCCCSQSKSGSSLVSMGQAALGHSIMQALAGHASQCGSLPLGSWLPTMPGLSPEQSRCLLLPPMRGKARKPKNPKGQTVKRPRNQGPRKLIFIFIYIYENYIYMSMLYTIHIIMYICVYTHIHLYLYFFLFLSLFCFFLSLFIMLPHFFLTTYLWCREG